MEIRKNQKKASEVYEYNEQRLPELESLREQYNEVMGMEQSLHDALNDLQNALVDRTTNIVNEELALVSILIKAKRQRKELFDDVSSQAQQSIQKDPNAL